MPRCVNHNSRCCRRKASGLAVVTVAGRDFYLGPWKSQASLAEYNLLLAAYFASGRRAPAATTSELSVAELIERYWEFAKQYYGQNHEASTPQLCRIKAAFAHLTGSTD